MYLGKISRSMPGKAVEWKADFVMTGGPRVSPPGAGVVETGLDEL